MDGCDPSESWIQMMRAERQMRFVVPGTCTGSGVLVIGTVMNCRK
jgi:hypothetical protein